MPTDLLALINIVATVCCGLMAGLMFAYSASVVAGLDDLPPAESIDAMNAMNRTLLNPFFGVVFFGAIAASVALGIHALTNRDLDARGWLLVGAGAYVVGVFLVTVLFNVPMNNRLAALDLDQVVAADSWSTYSRRWVWLNHFRTVCACVAATSFAVASTRR